MAHVIQTVAGSLLVGGEASTITADGFGRPVVVSTTNGALYCNEHQFGWCNHISGALERIDDAGAIETDYKLYGTKRLIVPMVPSQRIYARIGMEAFIRSGIFRTWLEEPAIGDVAETVPLGYIGPGDGRLQLRQMIFQIILPEMSDQSWNYACHSMRHNLERAERISSDRKLSRALAAAHLWTLKFYKKCIICLSEEGPGVKFDADLLPER